MWEAVTAYLKTMNGQKSKIGILLLALIFVSDRAAYWITQTQDPQKMLEAQVRPYDVHQAVKAGNRLLVSTIKEGDDSLLAAVNRMTTTWGERMAREELKLRDIKQTLDSWGDAGRAMDPKAADRILKAIDAVKDDTEDILRKQ